MCPNKSLSSRSPNSLVRDTIPFLLWVLSAGEGTGALVRGTTSEKLLKSSELRSFERHASILCALGLTYRPNDNVDTYRVAQTSFRMEPPIDDLTFCGLEMSRQEIPSSVSLLCCSASLILTLYQLKELLSRKIRQSARAPMKSLESPSPASRKRNSAPLSEVSETATGKKAKHTLSKRPENFLAVGAKQAKAARHARNAARVGFQTSRQEKLANTGSGKKLSEVVRLRFIKGFTEAVRIPCRMDDL
jgi:chromosome transmission fidelity protein 18